MKKPTRYAIVRPSPFYDFAYAVVGYEIRPGNTVTFLQEIDLTRVEEVRAGIDGEQKPTYTAFVAKAFGLAMREFPYANRRIYRLAWLPFSRVRLQTFTNCDVAVASERSVPGVDVAAFIDVLRDVDHLGLDEITAWLRALARSDVTTNKQWREFSTTIERFPPWLSTLVIRLPVFFPALWAKYRGGAIVISSPGKYGVDSIVGTWPSPLGVSFGEVRERPLVRGRQVVPGPTFFLTMNFDRRVMAGAQAAHFFRRVADLLENLPEEMLAPSGAVPTEASAQASRSGQSSGLDRRLRPDSAPERSS